MPSSLGVGAGWVSGGMFREDGGSFGVVVVRHGISLLQHVDPALAIRDQLRRKRLPLHVPRELGIDALLVEEIFGRSFSRAWNGMGEASCG
jgi:hypothetical protein